MPGSPALSPEQRAALVAFDTHNVVVNAVAGAGKTTLMLACARNMPVGRRALLLTYNSALKTECRERVRSDQRLNGHVDVHTFHSLMRAALDGRPSHDDRLFLDNLDAVRDGRLRTKPWIWDVLFIDEAQDMRTQFLAFLHELMRTADPARLRRLHVMLVGDPQQLLYDYHKTHPADRRFMDLAERLFPPGRAWTQRALTVSFRTTPPVADFLAHLMGERRIEPGRLLGEADEPPAVELVVTNTWGNGLHRYIERAVDECGAANAMVLAPSVRPGSKQPVIALINALCDRMLMHVMAPDLSGDAAAAEGKLRVSTYNAAKGLQADTVVVFGFDGFGDRSADVPNKLWVALTRSCRRLVLVQDAMAGPHPALRGVALAEAALGPRCLRVVRLGRTRVYEPADPSPRRPMPVTAITSHVDAESLRALLRRYVRVDAVVRAGEHAMLSPNMSVAFRTDADERYVEDVSPLYGLAVGLGAEYALTGRCRAVDDLLRPLLVRARTTDQEREALAQANPGRTVMTNGEYAALLPVAHRKRSRAVYTRITQGRGTAADFLLLANSVLAFHRFHHLLGQVRDYAWADEGAFAEGRDRLVRAVVSACAGRQDVPMLFEALVTWPRPGEEPYAGLEDVRMRGFADAFVGDDVFEFKFVNTLRDEHVLQTALYLAGRCKDGEDDEGGVGYLANGRTGEVVSVRVAGRDRDALIANAIKVKLATKPPAVPDDAFLAENAWRAYAATSSGAYAASGASSGPAHAPPPAEEPCSLPLGLEAEAVVERRARHAAGVFSDADSDADESTASADAPMELEYMPSEDEEAEMSAYSAASDDEDDGNGGDECWTMVDDEDWVPPSSGLRRSARVTRSVAAALARKTRDAVAEGAVVAAEAITSACFGSVPGGAGALPV
jgi:hypothetical protein